MRLIQGSHYKVRWIDAFEDAGWTSEEQLEKLIAEHTQEEQSLYFIKQTPDLYIFTSGRFKPNSDYLDIHAIPKGFIKSIKAIR